MFSLKSHHKILNTESLEKDSRMKARQQLHPKNIKKDNTANTTKTENDLKTGEQTTYTQGKEKTTQKRVKWESRGQELDLCPPPTQVYRREKEEWNREGVGTQECCMEICPGIMGPHYTGSW